MSEIETPVLIVGAGLVGLSAALALHTHGVPARVVERHPGTSRQPKARRFTFRTMEIFRSYGVADEVYAAAEGLAAYQGMRAGRTLREAQPLSPPPHVDYAELLAATPEQSCLVAQDLLEPVLLALARERGVPVEFNTDLVALRAHETGVEARLRRTDTGATSRINAEYLTGADGARSTVRDLLGIKRSGLGSLGRAVSVVCEVDLGALTEGREFNLCQIDHPDAPGAFASIDGRKRWLYYTSELHPVSEDATPADTGRWADVIRTAAGVSDVDVAIESVQAWEPAMLVADRFVADRVLLAGDAAHVMPPYAAAGANTGIQDTANLAWKLAAVRAGTAGTGLIETYHTERHAAGYHAAEQSALRTGELRAQVTDPDPALDHPFALVVGYGYPGGALIADDSGPQPTDRLELSGRPGTRLPHLTTPSGKSTVDLMGTGLTLLPGPAADGWRSAARANGIPVADPGGDWPAVAHIQADGALLVRPDHIVAWRAFSGEATHQPGRCAAFPERSGADHHMTSEPSQRRDPRGTDEAVPADEHHAVLSAVLDTILDRRG